MRTNCHTLSTSLPLLSLMMTMFLSSLVYWFYDTWLPRHSNRGIIHEYFPVNTLLHDITVGVPTSESTFCVNYQTRCIWCIVNTVLLGLSTWAGAGLAAGNRESPTGPATCQVLDCQGSSGRGVWWEQRHSGWHLWGSLQAQSWGETILTNSRCRSSTKDERLQNNVSISCEFHTKCVAYNKEFVSIRLFVWHLLFVASAVFRRRKPTGFVSNLLCNIW